MGTSLVLKPKDAKIWLRYIHPHSKQTNKKTLTSFFLYSSKRRPITMGKPHFLEV